MAGKVKDFSGRRYGKLLVLGEYDWQTFKNSTRNTIRWKCLCDCGNIKFISASSLRSGAAKSCGCYSREYHSKTMTKHGLFKSREYNIYRQMVARASNPEHRDYILYGSVGVCDRWCEPAPQGFLNFIEDMGMSPFDHASLDRIDGRSGYSPSNCRWATKSVQSYNQRRGSNNKSGKSGVFWLKRDCKWLSYINYNRKRIILGRFLDFDEAVRARLDAELRYFGEIKRE